MGTQIDPNPQPFTREEFEKFKEWTRTIFGLHFIADQISLHTVMNGQKIADDICRLTATVEKGFADKDDLTSRVRKMKLEQIQVFLDKTFPNSSKHTMEEAIGVVIESFFSRHFDAIVEANKEGEHES